MTTSPTAPRATRRTLACAASSLHDDAAGA